MTTFATQFDFNPYAFNAVSLFIIGLVSVIYLLRIPEKTAAIWFLTAGLSGLTLGMVSMFFSGIVLWGGAFLPLTESCAVLSMAALLGFNYHYPQRVRSREATIVRFGAVIASLFSVGISLPYAYRFFKLQAFGAAAPAYFWFINPVMFLAALFTAIRRTCTIQERSKGWRGALASFYRPSTRPARVMRNFSLALALGLLQGIATAGQIPPLLAVYAVNLSLLLMTVAIVYASLDLTQHPPGLIVRLTGLALVTLLVILGATGILAVNTATKEADAQSLSYVEVTRRAIRSGAMTALPEEVIYVAVWPDEQMGTLTPGVAHGQLLYQRSVDFNYPSLLSEQQQRLAGNLPAPVWGYFVEQFLRAPDRAAPVITRYGPNPAGSFYQYAGYTFQDGSQTYEVGFSLEQMSRMPRRISLIMLYTVIGGSLFILLIFPRFFQANLIWPLDRLLAGVRQVDAGNLDISIPVSYRDEVGFLTASFNKMAASLRGERTQRQHAEGELRDLTDSLEQRVADRTRELSTLYDVSTTASQALDSQTLLEEALAHTTRALHSPTGFIALRSAGDKTPGYELTTSRHISPDWQVQIEKMILAGELFETINRQDEPILIANTTADPRAPLFLQNTPMTLLIAPLPAAGQVLGMIGVFRELGQSYNLDEITLLISIAGQVGSAVQAGRLRQQNIVLEERQRLARDLHDSVIQSLYGLVTLAEAGKMHAHASHPEMLLPIITRISKTARQAIREMRLFIHQLRPLILEQEGLVNALDLRLAAVEGRSDLQARLLADPDLHLPPPVEAAFYQIAQEALNNSLRHAQAASVTVSLRQEEGRAVLQVRDDGQGFDLDEVGFGGQGLNNMRMRAAAIGGELEIITAPGAGTTVRVSVDCMEAE